MAQQAGQAAVQLVRSQVIRSSLVIRGNKSDVAAIYAGLSEDLGYEPPVLAETLFGAERSLQLRLRAEDWARVPPLSHG